MMAKLLVLAGQRTGLFAALLMLLRFVLQAVIAIWSLRADKAGRAHALDLLRTLRFRSEKARGG
jgi:hypothetical protein